MEISKKELASLYKRTEKRCQDAERYADKTFKYFIKALEARDRKIEKLEMRVREIMREMWK